MRLRVLLPTFALIALLASAGPAAASSLSYPSAAALSASTGFIPDATLGAREARLLLAGPNYWGGRYTSATGELVTVYVSDSYPQDTAVPQRWADFLSGLVHGSELGQLTAYLAPLREVQSLCGLQSLACYSPRESLLVAPGEAPASDITAEAVVTHEYGHHVAAHRSNAPWPAVDWGTKRWASSIQVCRRTRAGTLKPGAEDVPNYFVNPGEGFAESYRVLNERKAGLVETPWDVVDRSLYPSPQALTLLEQDVTSPWTKAATTSYRGSVSSASRARTFAVPTVLDGTLRVALRASNGVRLRLRLTAAATKVGERTVAAGHRSTIGTTICGARSYTARVTRLRGAGAFTLTVTRP